MPERFNSTSAPRSLWQTYQQWKGRSLAAKVEYLGTRLRGEPIEIGHPLNGWWLGQESTDSERSGSDG